MREDLEAWLQPSAMTTLTTATTPICEVKVCPKWSLRQEGPEGKDLHAEKVLEMKIYTMRRS
jgi:hypothetical protein